MRCIALAAVVLAAALPAAAQTPVAPRVYDVAPWWMDKPVIPSVGYVWTEVPANRAYAQATYQAIDRSAEDATKQAADKVRALGQALEAYGADKVRVTTAFAITPLYAQYRDKEGNLNDNERADKIERYQVSTTVSVEVRDVRLAERVYATLMAARPSSTEQMSFRLEPDNETRTQMFRRAVEDARRRALLGAEAAGTGVGAAKVIDPTGRACQTDVLLAGRRRRLGRRGLSRPAPGAAPAARLRRDRRHRPASRQGGGPGPGGLPTACPAADATPGRVRLRGLRPRLTPAVSRTVTDLFRP
ncbi:SIMPL domain-containing protein [Phenylobacterium sp. J367]|uniref:SIMPL domain-containing protein n=1 Tax=Phenylobacterium sp. J367 TaxID=2898435 RepID=UPI0021508444|nr:SIMPL domain-containing protein [Phenylobacterium sp. J367]MCR5880431.1 SIMPL domain-containing protein [Phenylobacterium sp. J367]